LGSTTKQPTGFAEASRQIKTLRPAYFYLAAALVHLGRLDEARAAVKAGIALDPAFTILRFRAGASSDNQTYLAQLERVIEGMRAAGIPEG